MNRVVAITALTLTLGACSGGSSWIPELPRGTPAATTVQFESEPAGAEARTSQGQACRTPCSMAVAANEFSVTFTQPGFQPQTVPVRVVTSNEGLDPNTGEVPPPRLAPNPVYVELMPGAPPPPAARSRRPPPKPATAQATNPRVPRTTTRRRRPVPPRRRGSRRPSHRRRRTPPRPQPGRR